ncbi:coproporphyrinogen III oxidase [Platysternon megacephalum]|uniref:Coproporphyrinogen III oxidase n=1 Tax=Platysternon megacephalum TaxID=55544 RepID=A0A4D9DH54_9SAUR|nr:coproporphyrinogen III oxidase [Platysternon megacephalum]
MWLEPPAGPAPVYKGAGSGRSRAVKAAHIPKSSKMSYTLDTFGNPSYRRVTESRATYSRASASPSSGFRSQSWSRGSPSTVSSPYKRSALGAQRVSYGSTVLSSSESLESSLLNGAGDFKLSRSSEKEQLQGLNDRFAGYIEKVHYLEQQNKEIEAEIAALRQKQAGRAQLGDAYEQELRELRCALEQVNHEKAQLQLDSEHVEEDIQRVKERFEEEARLRDETDATIRALRKDMEEASMVKVELDKKVQSLQDEVAFLRGNHEEEVAELLAQIQASHITVERKDYMKTDITSALKEIRSQLECHSDQNMHQAEEWFKCRYAKLTEAAEHNKEAIRTAKEEIAEYRRQLQSKSVELESVRGTKESLERQLNDIEERHNNDLTTYQVSDPSRAGEKPRGLARAMQNATRKIKKTSCLCPCKINSCAAERPCAEQERRQNELLLKCKRGLCKTNQK